MFPRIVNKEIKIDKILQDLPLFAVLLSRALARGFPDVSMEQKSIDSFMISTSVYHLSIFEHLLSSCRAWRSLPLVTITNDLKWNTHISNICIKANRALGFLRRTLFSCPQNVKEAAYKGMVRPILEYGSSVWDPHPDKLQEELEKVQNRAARFVTRNYVYETGSMTGILGQLKWESLKKR